eukprot:4204088-Prymnesium_polylepis.1
MGCDTHALWYGTTQPASVASRAWPIVCSQHVSGSAISRTRSKVRYAWQFVPLASVCTGVRVTSYRMPGSRRLMTEARPCF